MLWQEAKRQSLKWLWYVLGPVGVLIILVIVICIALVMVLSGGTQGGINTYVGSAQALPASWLGVVDQAGGELPNVVTLGVMELESGGRANATNYNLSNGKASNTEPIGQPGVKILSADAGLMQINSGFPPYWPARPKWDRVFGPGSDPYDPAKNIAEGVNEIYWNTRNNEGYLSKGLSAYNTGSGNSGIGNQYANKVLANILAFESGPEADAWATGNYSGQADSFLWWHWGARQWVQPYPNAQTWILVAGSFPIPDNTPTKVLWGPPVEKHEPPQTFEWLPLSPPSKVIINGQEAALDPPGAPIMPGQTVFGLQVTQPGTYTATAEWDWVTWVGKPPQPVYHKKTVTAPAIKILPPDGTSS